MNIFYKVSIFAIITFFTSACTSDLSVRPVNSSVFTPQPYEYWSKEGMTQQNINDKLGHCRVEVGAENLSKGQADKLISYCMKSDNYHLVKGLR